METNSSFVFQHPLDSTFVHSANWQLSLFLSYVVPFPAPPQQCIEAAGYIPVNQRFKSFLTGFFPALRPPIPPPPFPPFSGKSKGTLFLPSTRKPPPIFCFLYLFKFFTHTCRRIMFNPALSPAWQRSGFSLFFFLFLSTILLSVTGAPTLPSPPPISPASR